VFTEDHNLPAALNDYAKAIELNPRNNNARVRCANIYLKMHRPTEALMQSTVVLKTNERFAAAYISRAEAYAQLGINAEATNDLETATRLSATDPAALNLIAWCRATSSQRALRDGRKAIESATQACELDHWKHWNYIDTLAAALGEAGDFDSAAKYQAQAIAMTPVHDPSRDRESNRLTLYNSHQPYRDETR
jgi:tetratricopeptide (TPR) repeat protein